MLLAPPRYPAALIEFLQDCGAFSPDEPRSELRPDGFVHQSGSHFLPLCSVFHFFFYLELLCAPSAPLETDSPSLHHPTNPRAGSMGLCWPVRQYVTVALNMRF